MLVQLGLTELISVLVGCGLVYTLEGLRFYFGNTRDTFRTAAAYPRRESQGANFLMLLFGPPALLLGIYVAHLISHTR